jgi:FkbM family methyltransferase
MIRKIVEKLARNKILKRHMPNEFGGLPFYITPESQLRYLNPNKYKAFGKELLGVVSRYVNKDSVVWDIGANVGVFTFASAGLIKNGSGEILAIEADIFLANMLNTSRLLDKNKNINIKILPIAVSESIGISQFEIAQRGRASNSLASSDSISRTSKGGVRFMNYVPTFTIDSLLNDFKAPTFIKIDVEGAELFVIKGMSKILQEIKPIIYIEVGDEHIDEITKILKTNNYELYDESENKIEKCVFNTLAKPIKRF